MFVLLPICWLVIQSVCLSPATSACAEIPAPESILNSTTDAGKTWRELGGQLPADFLVFCFGADAQDIYIGGHKGLYRRPVAEPVKEWVREPSTMGDIRAIYPGKAGPYAVGMEGGFFQHVAATGVWEARHAHLRDREVHTLLEAPAGVLLAGCTSGVYRTEDSGRTWSHTLALGPVYELVMAHGVILARGVNGLWRSADEGLTWDRVLTSAESPVRVRAFANEFVVIVEGRNFAGVRMPNNVYMSEDNGLTWQLANLAQPEGKGQIFDMVEAGAFWFAGSGTAVYRSGDRGATWQVVLRSPQKRNGFFRLDVAGKTLYSLFMDGC